MKKGALIIICCLLLLLTSLFGVTAQDYASESSCHELCAQGDYNAVANCFKGFRSRADAFIATANCAYNAGANADAEKYAVKSARYRASWATFILNKVPSITIHTGGTADSYVLAYVASDKEKHLENAFRYARTSGQCANADDRDACAEQYVNWSIISFSNRETITARNTNPELAERNCNWQTEFKSWAAGECTCRKGFEKSAGECVLPLYKISSISTQSAVNVEEAFEQLKPTGASVHDLTLTNGSKIKLGISKKSDGSPTYTIDGKKWSTNLKTLLEPSWKDKASGMWSGFTSAINPLNWFDTKYKDKKKQLYYEIAKDVRAEFIADGKDPKILEERLWDKYQEAQGNQQAEQQLIQDLVDKGLVSTAADMTIDKVKGQLYTYFVNFPGEAVNKFAQEASDTDFFQAVYYYAQYRDEGRSAASLQAQVPEEMLATVSIVTVESFTEGTYWNKLEEAYQRYSVAEAFGVIKN